MNDKMSLRRKRKVSAPGRLASPFVGDEDEELIGNAGAQHRFFSRKISYALDRRSGSSSLSSDHGSIVEQLTAPYEVVFEDDELENQSLPPSIVVDEDDEGYISPNSNLSPPVLPDNPGELALYFLMSSFVSETEKKIERFSKSVSIVKTCVKHS
jgi:hypothetical protein